MNDDDKSTKPDFVPYDAEAAIALVKKVFPRSTAESLQRSTMVPMRQVTRWLNGDSRIPPGLLAKLEKQLALKSVFDDRVRTVYADMREEFGFVRQVARSCMLELAHHDHFEDFEDL
ncbi:hypothetical protein VQ042_15815 [Aurantimonas sp. A2-1-M11]|uniref:hypothetical protein n=1 Tax=Aurantimonas sp. A2-1-M11 TaxID=3113712 RepID=UPI002F929692